MKTEGDPEADMFDFFKPHGGYTYFKKQPDGTVRHETEVAGDRAIEFLRSEVQGNPREDEQEV
ncbi:MAG: hypothetical protein U9Q97_02955 [Acidobacteriota bacterium]|nr:hypothetical protein [Acidobacteriota bacterium]